MTKFVIIFMTTIEKQYIIPGHLHLPFLLGMPFSLSSLGIDTFSNFRSLIHCCLFQWVCPDGPNLRHSSQYQLLNDSKPTHCLPPSWHITVWNYLSACLFTSSLLFSAQGWKLHRIRDPVSVVRRCVLNSLSRTWQVIGIQQRLVE